MTLQNRGHDPFLEYSRARLVDIHSQRNDVRHFGSPIFVSSSAGAFDFHPAPTDTRLCGCWTLAQFVSHSREESSLGYCEPPPRHPRCPEGNKSTRCSWYSCRAVPTFYRASSHINLSQLWRSFLLEMCPDNPRTGTCSLLVALRRLLQICFVVIVSFFLGGGGGGGGWGWAMGGGVCVCMGF